MRTLNRVTSDAVYAVVEFFGRVLIVALMACAPLLALNAHLALADEYLSPFNKAASESYAKLVAKDFPSLEKDAIEARRTDASISDGQPLLAAIYGGTAGCLSQGCPNVFSDEQWQQRLKLLEEWQKQFPTSVTAQIALASFDLQYAYVVRGQGIASTVSKDAWPQFRSRLKQSERSLNSLGKRARADAGWYSSMLDVGLAQHWPEGKFNRIFQSSRQKFPIYLQLYETHCAYYSPRWYGSVEQVRTCIADAASATEKQLGDTMYARLNWALATNGMFNPGGQADWPRMKAGFERLSADFPDPWNLNTFAVFACWAMDVPALYEVFEKIGPNDLEFVWNFWPNSQHDSCRKLAYEKTADGKFMWHHYNGPAPVATPQQRH